MKFINYRYKLLKPTDFFLSNFVEIYEYTIMRIVIHSINIGIYFKFF